MKRILGETISRLEPAADTMSDFTIPRSSDREQEHVA